MASCALCANGQNHAENNRTLIIALFFCIQISIWSDDGCVGCIGCVGCVGYVVCGRSITRPRLRKSALDRMKGSASSRLTRFKVLRYVWVYPRKHDRPFRFFKDHFSAASCAVIYDLFLALLLKWKTRRETNRAHASFVRSFVRSHNTYIYHYIYRAISSQYYIRFLYSCRVLSMLLLLFRSLAS